MLASVGRLVRNSYFLPFISRGLAAAGSFGLSIVLGKALGAIALGQFMAALSLVVILGVVARFGTDNAIVRFGAIAHGMKDKYTFGLIQRKALKVMFSLLGAFFIFLVIFRAKIGQALFEGQQADYLMILFACMMLTYALIYHQSAVIKSLKRPAISPFFETGSVASIVSLSVVGLVLLELSIDLEIVTIITLFASALIAFFGFFVIGVIKKREFPDAIIKPRCSSEAFYSSLPDYFVISISAFLVQWGVILLLGLLSSSDQAGIFTAVHRISFVINFILLVVNSVISPKIAFLYERGDMVQLKSIVHKATFGSLIIASVFALVLGVAAPLLLRWMGSEFVDALPMLYILLFSQIINVATGSVGVLLNMTGHQSVFRSLSILTAVGMCALCFLLIPLYGAWGAVVANSICLILQNILAAIKVRKLIGFYALPFIDRASRIQA